METKSLYRRTSSASSNPQTHTDNYQALFSTTVYPELKRLAANHLRRERANHTLSPTALVNEAYLKLQGQRSLVVADRHHLMALSSRCIRQILVDHAREKYAQKRGGHQTILTLQEELAGDFSQPDVDLILLDQLLSQLKKRDEIQEKIVEYRFFAGMTNEEIAESLAISIATVKRKWTLAKAWLYREMNS
jgi:RNA polymerase sigma factor (TIGR02999 family)